MSLLKRTFIGLPFLFALTADRPPTTLTQDESKAEATPYVVPMTNEMLTHANAAKKGLKL